MTPRQIRTALGLALLTWALIGGVAALVWVMAR